MIRKGDMKQAAWIAAYENWNVDIGLSCGLAAMRRSARACGHARSDAAMLEQKIAHPKAGREHRLGSLANRRDAARHPLPRR